MDNLLICLSLLFLLVISGIITRFVPTLPAPIIQICLAALIRVFFPAIHIELDPELFLFLFIPPLLFYDSWHFPKREFLLNKRAIIMLSIGLVFFTVAGIGFLVHWLIPQIPLPAGFALAAALSPTDAVALRSMTAKIQMPRRIMNILQGEALLNDASSLVSLKFAIAAMLTGFFSIAHATYSFFLIAFGGLVIGVVVTYFFIRVLGQLTDQFTKETTTENLLLILLPFTVYFLAEHLGFSGIIAAVSAGFAIDRAGFLDRTIATTRIEGHFVWGMLDFTFNGLIFILLGLFLPDSLQLLEKTGFSLAHCLTIIAIITLTIIVLRFVWIYLSLPFEALIARRRKTQWQPPNLKIIVVLALGGVRGAIALAAILSLPAFNSTGNPFPARDLMIIVVDGVVLCSLLLSAVVLPLLLPSLSGLIKKSNNNEENFAISSATHAAIEAIQNQLQILRINLDEQDTELCVQVANMLIAGLNPLLVSQNNNESDRLTSMKLLSFEAQLRFAAIDAARQELRTLRKQKKINNTTMMSVINKLDLRQMTILQSREHLWPSP